MDTTESFLENNVVNRTGAEWKTSPSSQTIFYRTVISYVLVIVPHIGKFASAVVVWSLEITFWSDKFCTLLLLTYVRDFLLMKEIKQKVAVYTQL